MPFSFLNIQGFIGNGAFWVSCCGYGFFIKDTSINKLTLDEIGEGGTYIGSLFFRSLKP